MFILHCKDANERAVSLRYEPHESTLTNLDGTKVIRADGDGVRAVQAPVTRISPLSPGRKVAEVAVLKIQLGLGCNYSCSYCNQANQIDAMAMSSTADAARFITDLDAWLEGHPSEIELWGGEPLLYFRKLQVLVPELDRRFPEAEISMVTNGSLLTREILDFLAHYDIRLTVSHDGPGQHLRGEDPFDHPERGPLLRELWNERKRRHRMMFSSVLTPDNNDPVAIREWFVKKLGDPSVVTTFEGIVAVHDDKTLAGLGTWRPEQYAELRENVALAFESGEAIKIPALLERAKGFVQSIIQEVSTDTLGQKCAMDRSDHVAVDLHSNVLTCHNTGANARHGLGSALKIEQVRLDTSTHWSHRECCGHCPVLHFCGGSCMYLEGEQFAQSCENEYQLGLGLLDGTLRRALGLKLQSIEGDVRRPTRRRTIPIAGQPRAASAVEPAFHDMLAGRKGDAA